MTRKRTRKRTRKKPAPKPTPKANRPLKLFTEMAQTWELVAAACDKHGIYEIAKSIRYYLAAKRQTEMVTIKIPLETCGAIGRACAPNGPGCGVKFVVAGSAFEFPKTEEPKPSVEMREAVKNAKEELERMES